MTQKKQVLCDLQVLFPIYNCQTPGYVLITAVLRLRMGRISVYFLNIPTTHDRIPSLTVVGIKNRYNHCIYWFVAIFFFVTKFSIFLSSFTFFLNIFHLTFGYKLIVCSKITGIMKGICNFGSFIGWNKSLFLNFSEV